MSPDSKSSCCVIHRSVQRVGGSSNRSEAGNRHAGTGNEPKPYLVRCLLRPNRAVDMLNTGMRLWSAAALVLMMLCLASPADARDRRYYGYFPRNSEQFGESDRYRAPNRYDPDDRTPGREFEPEDARSRRSRPGGPFGATVEQLTRVCAQTGAELKSWPFDSIAQIVRPDEDQRNALEELRSTVAQAADALASDCPRNVPAPPSGRLQAADQGIESAVTALKSVQPAIKTFYGLLDDEQKARLVAKYVMTNAAQETTGRRSRWRDNGDGDRAISPAQWDAICGQWAAALRDWPVARIERDIRLSETQRVAFYDVVAASLKAAGTLMTACSVEAALTPAVRMETLTRRLEAIRQATAMVQPPLAAFYETLDSRQKMRFAE